MNIFETAYPVRSFTFPSRYVLPVVVGNNYPDNIIDGLYNYFSANYANRIGTVIENQKKGILSPIDVKTQYLEQSLYVLRNWYNSTTEFTSVTLYSVIQQIIENCLKICGNVNTANLATLTADNVYTSLGQTPPASIPGYTIYTDDIYFV